jgi:hypothetical protein
MTLNFTLNGVKQSINPQGGNYSLNYPCSSKTTCYPYESEFPPGKYSFNVYGAGGGYYANGYDSPGGFSTGVLVLKQKTRLYFYVGAKGLCDTSSGGISGPVFGGGGSGHGHPGASCYGCSGGGASDIRVIQNTLNHRVIVAGGAGGSGYNSKHMFGGKGGGTSGAHGENYSSGNIGGGPGNQTSGGSSGNQAGIFGYGGNKTFQNGAGGGGGWYGGGAAGGSGVCGCAAGGGGSGFIFTQLNPLVSLNSSFLLISGKTETNTGNNIGDGRINIEILGIIIQKTKIHRTCNCQNVFVLPLLLFWPFIMS